MLKTTFDQRVLELAVFFVGSADTNKEFGDDPLTLWELGILSKELAIDLQQAIEDFMEIATDNYENILARKNYRNG